MRVLIFDTETTGLDPKEDIAIELAGIIYDTRLRCALAQFATLIHTDRDNTCESINKIPTEALAVGALDAGVAWGWLAGLANVFGIEAVVAHSADFDKGFTPAESPLHGIPWCCTREGFDWPKQNKPGSSLVSLALEHGLGVVDPHRALNDCSLIARLFTRLAEQGVDLDPLIRLGCEPRIRLQALVSFEEKDQAKEAGFMWESSTKRWLRSMQRRKAVLLPFKWQEATRAVPETECLPAFD